VRIFSGIQPTGGKHLGNYIGAIRQYVEGQDRGEAIYCIVDLHAITVPYEPAELRRTTLDTTAILLAAGVDPDRCILFRQSDVREHSELCWLLSGVTAYGDLTRMTQFKEKSAKQQELVSAGIFIYPVLQAADILVYNADEVPVGDDQRQHLELARDVAERFNARFGETFVVPEPHILRQTAKVLDLQQPGAKMSKSASSPAGIVDLLDEPRVSAKKIRSAVTDSGHEVTFDPVDKPGLSNLLTIHSALSGRSVDDIVADYAGRGYGDLKRDLAALVEDLVTPIRERTVELLDDRAEIDSVLADGASRARSVASATLAAVYDRVGFVTAR
jgi:tryptophanyl-tRNA synthetase